MTPLSYCCSVTQSCATPCDPMNCSTPRFPVLPSLSLRVCSNLCPLSQWCPPTISPSASLFTFCLQSFPAAGSFPTSWLFASGGQSTGTSASVLPMNIHGWFPLELTGLISLLSKGLSRVFSSTTIWKHQFLRTEPSLCSNSHNRTFLLFLSILIRSLLSAGTLYWSAPHHFWFFAIWLFKRQSTGRNHPSHTLRAVGPPWLCVQKKLASSSLIN